MIDRFKTYGKIIFDPIDKTNKHVTQASWKKVAMVDIKSDISEYYGWFIDKRFNIVLNPPLRKAHVTFINDRKDDLGVNGVEMWEKVKTKWDGKEVEVILFTSPRTDGQHWWLNIPEEERGLLHGIRQELSLGRPHWGLHLSIGYANEKNIAHSKYIHEMIKQGFIII